MNKFAKILSNILQPLLIPTYAMLLLFQVGNFSFFKLEFKLFTIIYILLLTAVIPLIVILLLKKLKLVSNIQLTIRKERTIPYVFTVISYFAAIFFLFRINMPLYVVGLMLGVLISTIIIMLVNFKWKISAHLSAMGGFCAAIMVVSFQLGINQSTMLAFSFILAGLLATSRLILQVHTLMQTIFGFITGFVSLLFFGLLL